jgi:hypothetical protein
LQSTFAKYKEKTSRIMEVIGLIYVAGVDVVNGVAYATYWKNGVATHLSPGAGGASAIYVQ